MSENVIRISEEFLRVAAEIETCSIQGSVACNLTTCEGLIRTGISRAYYASFLIAREALGLRDIKGSEIHKLVIEKLKEDDHPDIADKLYSLRRLRRNADYETEIYLTGKELRRAVMIAKHVITGIRKHYSCMF